MPSAKPDTSSFKNSFAHCSRDMMEMSDLIPIGIFYADEDGTCVYANALWHDIFGLDPTQACQDFWLDQIH